MVPKVSLLALIVVPAAMVTVPAVPLKFPVVALPVFKYVCREPVELLNRHKEEVVSQVPVPPVAAPAPFASQNKVVWAMEAWPSNREPARVAKHLMNGGFIV